MTREKIFKPGDVVAFLTRPNQLMAVRQIEDGRITVDWIDDKTGDPHQATYMPDQLYSSAELKERQEQAFKIMKRIREMEGSRSK